MAKVKAEIPDQEVEPVQPLAEEANSSLALRESTAVGAVTGDVSAKDIPMPLLSVVYGVGELATKFSPGDLVLDREHLLVKKTEPLTAILVSAEIYWKEYLDQAAYAASMVPRIFRTEEEVTAVGGSTVFGPNGERPTFKRAMSLKMLLEKPSNLECYLFNIDLLGSRGVGLEIIKQSSFALKQRGLLAGRWQITTAYEEIGANKVISPSIKLLPKQHTDAEIAEIKAAIGV
jgi:hypothetical protein